MKTILPTALLLLSLSSAWCETTIIENFDLGNRCAGEGLHQTNVGESGLVWESTRNLLLAGAGEEGYLSLGDNAGFKSDGSFNSRLSIPADVQVIIVEAEVRPTGKGWLGVGMGPADAASGNPTFGGLFLVVQPNGRFICAYNLDTSDWQGKSLKLLKGSSTPEFDPDGMSKLKLQYDRKGGVVTAWINGEEVVSSVSLEELGLKPDFSYAGFSGFGQDKDIRSVDNFKLTFKP